MGNPSHGFPISGDGKIHRLSSGDMISYAGDCGLLIIFARLRRSLLKRRRDILVFGGLLPYQNRLLLVAIAGRSPL